MARDFSANASNYLGLGTGAINGLTSGAAAVSLHAWVNIDVTDGSGANSNRVVNEFVSTV